MITLISFLGKGVADTQFGYRSARYRFEPSFVREVPFFGMALAEYLKPQRMILIGTSGSMWDVFFEHETAQDDESLLELIEAVGEDRVTAGILENQARRLSETLGYPVTCLLIDYARDEAGQVVLLEKLAATLETGEQIALDVTHAFRHLPMLALIAARYLKRVKSIEVDDIYYGAFDMSDRGTGEVPVLRLKGMLRMLDWIDALSSYDKDGDYGVFGPLLAGDGLAEEKARMLTTASFLERVNHTEGARQQLSTSLKAIAQHEGPLGRLFKTELGRRIDWVRKPERGPRELALADAYLARRDYLRCTIFLLEGLITSEVYKRKGNHDDFTERDEARKALGEANPQFRKLERLRNSLAHGQRSGDGEIASMLNDEQKLQHALHKMLRDLTR